MIVHTWNIAIAQNETHHVAHRYKIVFPAGGFEGESIKRGVEKVAQKLINRFLFLVCCLSAILSLNGVGELSCESKVNESYCKVLVIVLDDDVVKFQIIICVSSLVDHLKYLDKLVNQFGDIFYQNTMVLLRKFLQVYWAKIWHDKISKFQVRVILVMTAC